MRSELDFVQLTDKTQTLPKNTHSCCSSQYLNWPEATQCYIESYNWSVMLYFVHFHLRYFSELCRKDTSEWLQTNRLTDWLVVRIFKNIIVLDLYKIAEFIFRSLEWSCSCVPRMQITWPGHPFQWTVAWLFSSQWRYIAAASLKTKTHAALGEIICLCNKKPIIFPLGHHF